MHSQHGHPQPRGKYGKSGKRGGKWWVRPLAIGIALLAAVASMPAAHALEEGLPPVFAHGPVSYVSGGVGADEATAMKEAARAFPLEILFVEKAESGRRAYSADNQVVVLDAGGNTVLNTSSDGPYMLIDLPPGRYTVVAEDDGRYQKQITRISPGGHQRIVFQWASS